MDHESSFERAERLVERGDLRQALSVYREIELFAPSPAGPWWAELARRTGNVLEDLGRYDEALHAYATARRRAGGDQELHLVQSIDAVDHVHRSLAPFTHCHIYRLDRASLGTELKR